MSATVKVAELRDALSRFELKSMVGPKLVAVIKAEDGKLVFATPRIVCKVPYDGELAGTVNLNARMLSRYATLLPNDETVEVSLGTGYLMIGGTTFTRDMT